MASAQDPPYPQRPEGRLIDLIIKKQGRTRTSAAKAVGLSDTQLRNIIRGWGQESQDKYKSVTAPDDTLVYIAHTLGISPASLEKTGRRKAADELRAIQELEEPAAVDDQPAPSWDYAEIRDVLLAIGAEVEEFGARVKEAVKRLEELERRAGGGSKAPERSHRAD